MAHRIAVLGTGRMGSALARRLAGAGAELTLWDRTADRATALGLGRVAASPAEAAREGSTARFRRPAKWVVNQRRVRIRHENASGTFRSLRSVTPVGGCGSCLSATFRNPPLTR